MVKICMNSTNFADIPTKHYEDIIHYVQETTNLDGDCFYLEQNGKRLQADFLANEDSPIYVRLRILGGKGGFGSMLRAIGAQIEKTTNREACRDLSGRRLRDINEEKRLKAWLEKQGEREREAEERKKRKIEKLLAVPKHEFKDDNYEEARSKLTEKISDAVEEGFKKSTEDKKDLKRKQEPCTSQQAANAKKKKAALWIDDDLSDNSDDSDDDSDSDCGAESIKRPSTVLSSSDEATKDSSVSNTGKSDSESAKNIVLAQEPNSSDSEAVSIASK